MKMTIYHAYGKLYVDTDTKNAHWVFTDSEIDDDYDECIQSIIEELTN